MVALCAAGAFATAPAAPKHVVPIGQKLGYTVHQPADLEAGKKYPAVIWLHPSGGSMNARIVSDWWGELNQLKIFLVLPDSSNAAGWTEEDEGSLMAMVGDLVGKYAVDGRRLVLFGYSAGGQMGFHMVSKHPTRFASLVTMAAYPVTGIKEPALSLPPESIARRFSLLMLVGTADGGRQLCRQAEEQMRQKGFAVGLVEIPDLGHTYLINGKSAVLEWLVRIAQGQRPEVTADPKAIEARQARVDAARKVLEEILKGAEATDVPPKGLSFAEAAVSVHVPDRWKMLSDTPLVALLTTDPAAEDPLLIQIQHQQNPKGLEAAMQEHERRNRTNGIRYQTVGSGELKLGEQTWKLQQAVCLAYHRQTVAGGNTRVVDRQAMLTVCYRPLKPDGADYVRVVFLYTDKFPDAVQLVRSVLPTVTVFPKP